MQETAEAAASAVVLFGNRVVPVQIVEKMGFFVDIFTKLWYDISVNSMRE